MLTIDVAVAAYGKDGLEKIHRILPEKREGVRYVVSWQNSEGGRLAEDLITRGDLEVYREEKKGLSNNRNNALDHCISDIVMIADDDILYYPDFAERVRKAFESYSDMDMGLFKVDHFIPKRYPSADCRISLPFPKNYYANSIEIAFRRDKIGNLRFYPELGLNAPEMTSGEDELFVISAIKRGLNCRFINQTISRHPQPSTGAKATSGILKGMGYMIGVTYPKDGLIRIPLKAYRVAKSGKMKLIPALTALMQGFMKQKKEFSKISQQYRW